MKRIKVMTITIMLLTAGAIFSAFVYSDNDSKKAHDNHSTSVNDSASPLFWYHVNGSNVGELIRDQTYTKDEAAGNITPCDGNGAVCAVGGSTNNLEGQSISTAIAPGDNFRIKEN